MYSDIEDSDSSIDKNCKKISILLNSEEWKSIKPLNQNRLLKRNRLRLNAGWSDIIYEAMKRVTNDTCAWIFKYHCVNPTGSKFIIISGKCKECNSVINAFNDTGPDENDCLTLTCNITAGDGSEHLGIYKRKLVGEKREIIVKQLASGTLPINWRRNQATNITSDVEPGTLYSLAVLRKCKQEFIDKQNQLPSVKCPIQSLLIMKYTQPYNNFLHNIAADKFHVHYWSVEQMHIYNTYCKSNINNSILSIDATGTLVKKIDRPYNNTSGHIFLYCGVVHFNSKF